MLASQRLRAVAAGFVVALSGAAASGVEVTRGPYLQRISTSEAILRWRTDVPTLSWVGWGAAPGSFPGQAWGAVATTEHRLRIHGFGATEIVYYAVGDASGVLAGGDAGHRFHANRSPGDWRPTRIWVLGDSGTANSDAAAVRDAYLAWSGGAPTDLWLMLGDNAYLSGTDAQYQAAVFEMYPEMLRTASLWPVLGNHDALSSDSGTLTGPYFAGFSLPRNGEAGGRPSGTEAWYSFDSGQIHVVALDSADSSLAPGSPMLAWLASDLAANRRPWTIVVFHHPPYTKGSHDSDDPADSEGRMIAMRENVLPILEAHGVDLVLSGHSHGYERSYLLDGHYGLSSTFDPSMRLDSGDGDPDGDGPYRKSHGPHGGTLYVVAGSSGSVAGTIEPHPAMTVGISELGSLAIDVAYGALDLRFVTSTGVVADHVRLLDGDWIFCDGFESADALAWSPPEPGSISAEQQ